MKALVVDDEYFNNENLFSLLNKFCPAINVVGAATTIDEAIDLIHSHQPDLLFLDIQLGN